MRLLPAPAIATWLLKLFCSKAEDESLIGDLLEKYRQGSGRFWYWRQVTAIASVRLSRSVSKLLLSAAAMLVRHAFTLALVSTCLLAVLMSDIRMIFLIGILGGVLVGVLLHLLGNGANGSRNSRILLPDDSRRPSISIHHIPVEGAVGLLFAVGTMIIFGTGVAAIREIFALTAPLGFLGFLVLRYWRRRHSVKIEALNLHN
jgi:hypothetical protein